MKTLKHLLLIAAVVTATTLSVKAGPLYSPKGQEHAQAFRKAPVDMNEPNLATIRPNGDAKAWEVAQSLNKVGSASEIDLAHAARPTLRAKDSGYEVAWRENALRGVQIAPVK